MPIFTSQQDALATVSHNAIIKAILPDWAMNMTEKTRGVKVAYDELEVNRIRHIGDVNSILIPGNHCESCICRR